MVWIASSLYRCANSASSRPCADRHDEIVTPIAARAAQTWPSSASSTGSSGVNRWYPSITKRATRTSSSPRRPVVRESRIEARSVINAE